MNTGLNSRRVMMMKRERTDRQLQSVQRWRCTWGCFQTLSRAGTNFLSVLFNSPKYWSWQVRAIWCYRCLSLPWSPHCIHHFSHYSYRSWGYNWEYNMFRYLLTWSHHVLCDHTRIIQPYTRFEKGCSNECPKMGSSIDHQRGSFCDLFSFPTVTYPSPLPIISLAHWK